MNDVFFHDGNSLKKNVIKYIICLIPLYCYGIYKNGIVLYMKDLISFLAIFKFLLFLLGGLIIYVITNIILKKKINFDLLFLSLFVIPLFLPFNTNIFLYLIVMFIFLLFRKYYNLALIILIFSSFGNFVNPGESLGIYSFNIWDLLCGRNISGLGSSFIVGILGFIFMCFVNIYYGMILSISIISVIYQLNLKFKFLKKIS